MRTEGERNHCCAQATLGSPPSSSSIRSSPPPMVAFAASRCCLASRSDNVTSSGTYTGGVYPGGSVGVVNVQGLESPPQELPSPESSLATSSEQANPRHGSHGTPLHATISSGHGLKPESSASDSDCNSCPSPSEDSGPASGQPSSQTLKSQPPPEVSLLDACCAAKRPSRRNYTCRRHHQPAADA